MRTLLGGLTLAVLAAAALAQEEPVLRNPGFEEERDGTPAGWTVMGGEVEGVAVELAGDARSGDRCLRLVDRIADRRGGPGMAGVRQHADLEPGKAYVFSVWVKSLEQSGPKALCMQLRFLPSNRVAVVYVAPPADESWRQYSVAGRAPEGTERCQVYVYSEARATSVTLVDDAELHAVAAEALGIEFPLRVWGYEGIKQARKLNLRTPIVEGDRLATLVAPEAEEYEPAARAMGAAIKDRTGKELPVETSWEPGVGGDGTLIAIGNLNNNKLIERLYLNHCCKASAIYPGAGEYVLRTVHEPYGFAPGQNVLVIGASDAKGALAGALALGEMLGAGPQLALEQPVLSVSTAEPLTGEAREKVLSKKLVLDWFADFHRAALQYRDTGDLTYAERAKRTLLACADRYEQDPKFKITWPEQHTRGCNPGAAWDLLEEAPVFTDAERLRCESTLAVFLFQLTTLVYEWGHLHESETITWNHITYPLMGVYWLSRHFDRFYDGLDGRTDAMLAEVRGCFRGQKKSWKPQEDAMGYMCTSPRHTIEYTLAEGDYSYFESGNARTWAEYIVHCSNNRGDGSGFGDAGYGQAIYEIQGLPWALWYCKDGRYLWRLQQVYGGEWDNPYDPSVKPVPWEELVGATVIPLHRLVYEHTMERGYYGEGAAPPNVPLEKAFDKIALRASLEPDAPYLLIDGYSRGKHLQYDGNCITRYYADGEDWLIDDDYLVRNTTDHTMLSVIRDGRCAELEPACAAVERLADLPHAALLQTAVYEYNGINWRRSLCWIKDRSFAMIDEMEAAAPGDYTLDCIFKLLDRGEQELVDGRSLVTKRPAGPRIGSHELVKITDPAPGVAAAMKFEKKTSQLEFAVELAAGQYAVTTFGYGLNTGADSFWVSLDGGERLNFHIPVREFGPSSADHTKESPTPNITVEEDGMHRFTITLREKPGVMLDRIEMRDTQGNLVHTIEAEAPPPVPEELIPKAITQQFFIRSAGGGMAGGSGSPRETQGGAQVSTSTRINHIGLGVRYLRERLRQRLDQGQRCSTQNLFYSDTADERRELDVRRLTTANCLILREGRPWGLFGARAEELQLPADLQTDAGLYLFTPDFICVASAMRLGEVLAAGQPISVELDLASGQAHPAEGSQAPAVEPAQVKALATAVRDLVAGLAGQAGEPGAGQAEVESHGFATAWRLEAPPPETVDPEVSQFLPVDLDGDGEHELLVLRSNTVLCLTGDGDERWQQTTGGRTRSAAMGDVTGDGRPEILVGSEDESFYLYDAGGKLLRRQHADIGLLRGPSSVRTPKVGAVAITDLEDDGQRDLIIATLSGQIIRYDADFNQRWIFNDVEHGTRELRFVNLLDDDRNEILAGNRYGAVEVVSADGRARSSPSSELGDVEFDVGDINGDGALDVVNGSSTGRLRCWSPKGGYRWDFDNFGYANNDVAMADLDGDGTPEVLIASATGYIYALDGDGEPIAKAALPDGANNLALLGDDGAVAEILVACADGSVVALSPKLESVRQHRLPSEALFVEVMQAGAVTVVVGCRDGSVTALRLK